MAPAALVHQLVQMLISRQEVHMLLVIEGRLERYEKLLFLRFLTCEDA